MLPGLLILCALVRESQVHLQNPAKFMEKKNMQNTAKSHRNHTKYISVQYIWNLSWLLGLFTCCKLANLSWTFVTAMSNNIQNLPGILRLMLWKTGYSLWLRANYNLCCQKEPRCQTNKKMYDSPNKLFNFSCKIAGFTKAILTCISSQCFCCCCYCIGEHSLLPKKGKIAIFIYQISAKPIAFQQNVPRKLPRIWLFLTDHF